MLKIATQSLAGIILPGFLLFVSAGTLGWSQGWALLALFFGGSLATGLWLGRNDPGLLAERMKSPLSADQKPRDRAVIAAILICFAGWLIVMGLNARLDWSQTPIWAQALGAALIAAAFAGWAWVLHTNSFASVKVRVQSERGQTVISTGPYAMVRHPMYAAALLLMIGAPLLLGSLWGLLGLAVFAPLLAARALGEEAILIEGLPGYRGYLAKVRFRLLPGIW